MCRSPNRLSPLPDFTSPTRVLLPFFKKLGNALLFRLIQGPSLPRGTMNHFTRLQGDRP